MLKSFLLALLTTLSLTAAVYNRVDLADRYIKESPHVVYNSYSGLRWQDNSDVNNNIFTWEEANSYCQDLELDGLSEWRLPTLSELIPLRFATEYAPFEYTGDQVFWSSTWDSAQDPQSRHLVQDFTQGYTDYFLALSVNQYGARCVIGEYYSDTFFDKMSSTSSVHNLLSGYTFEHTYDPINVYENNESNGSILGYYYNNGYYKLSDNRAIKLSQTTDAFSLHWQIPKNPLGLYTKTYYDTAVQKCNDLVLDGYDDWRLPSASELDSFFESNNLHPPYVQQDIFRNIIVKDLNPSSVAGAYYWATGKWCVNFSGTITSSGTYTHGERRTWDGAAANYICVREGKRLPDLAKIIQEKLTSASSDGNVSGVELVLNNLELYDLYTESDVDNVASQSKEEGIQYVQNNPSEFNLVSEVEKNSSIEGQYYNAGYYKFGENSAVKLSQTTDAFSLYWQIPEGLNRTYYDNAVQKCNDLVLDGYDDWRLPSASELDSFFESNNLHPPYVQQEIFRNIGGTDDSSLGISNGYYWSSTSKWSVNFSGTITSSGTYTHGEGRAWDGAAANYICVREGRRIELTHASNGLYTEAAKDTAVASATTTATAAGDTAGRAYVQNNLTEISLVTQTASDTAISTATTTATAAGKQYVQDNLSEFDLISKPTIEVTTDTITNLDTGWTLTSTPFEITDLSVFDSVNLVWIFDSATASWSAYSSDADTMAAIDSTDSIGAITTIPAGSGVWVKK